MIDFIKNIISPQYNPPKREEYYEIRPQRAIKPAAPVERVFVINRETNTFGFADHRPNRPAENRDAILGNADLQELADRGLHGNMAAAATLKKLWNEGITASDAAKAVGMSLDWAKKRYAAFSKVQKSANANLHLDNQ